MENSVQQAIFTSAQTDRAAGYQVVASSPGVCAADRRELAVWGPSHDSLLETGPEAVSLNFHPLPSGACCLSRTVPAGWEYSGRGGHRIYTQCLVVPPPVLQRFANHPLALVRAAEEAGMWKVCQPIPATLPPLDLPGRAAAVDEVLLARVAQRIGPQGMGRLLQAALDSACLAVAGPVSPEDLIAALLYCLPPACRGEFSFSTGLKFSSRRPFHIVTLTSDPAQRRWLAHQTNVNVLDLSEPAAGVALGGWARLIERVTATGQIGLLAAELSKRRGDLTLADLPALGLQLLEELEEGAFRGPPPDAPVGSHDDQEADHLSNQPETGRPGAPLRAHAAHCRFEKTSASAATLPRSAAVAAAHIETDAPEAVEKLEALDDAVYDAMAGRAMAIERLRALWPAVLAELGDDTVAESREQYLRYALSLWDAAAEPPGVRDPSRAVLALEVLNVLFDEA